MLVAVDDDVAVPPHWPTAVTAPLADPAVGLVTCLYRGAAGDGGPWSRLGALGLDWQVLPNAILGESLGRARGCYGATMALRAETLERIGGFRALAGLLADDHALGAAVRRLGLRVVVAPDRQTLADVAPMARDVDLAVLHTSTPSFASDVKVAERLKAENPALKVGLIGAKVAVQAEASLRDAPAIDGVARNEFDFTVKEVAEGRDLAAIQGLSFRNVAGAIVHNANRPVLEDMDSLPFVSPVYRRDLDYEEYLYRLPEAPLRLDLRGARVQEPLHLLPLAADGGRAPLPHALGRQGDQGDPLDPGQFPGPARDLLRRRHLHRRPAARRGDRAQDGQAGRHLVLQREGQRAARDAAGAEAVEVSV